ncbi:hypothetical protein [Roseomonas mucosa]|uniref:hypothetical protein n=1 Tax=Roseomonas mucosa TaxID=207340 RepID=UPI0022467A75|nr:hypothetical protein [Roseomonas mucosa]UZO94695.1 Transcriptional regulatory protein [Roseomonas mucosa]
MNEMSKKPEIGAAASRRAIVLRQGRGRQGGTTALDLLIQLARAEGRPVLVGDGDRNNSSLASYYPPESEGGATQPLTGETEDVKDWITETVAEAIRLDTSLVIDVGGGDRVMEEYGRDLALVEFCEANGFKPLGLFFCGPEESDLRHVLSLWRAGYFRPSRSVVVFQEYLVPRGRTPSGAFEELLGSPEMDELLQDGVRFIFLPRLPCMGEVRKLKLGFVAAATGEAGPDGKALDVVRQFMVRQWIGKVQKEFARIEATEWLP